MTSGERCTIKVTWQEFQAWQRWDEFPERADDPPLTVDMMFFYEGNAYFINGYNYDYALLDEDWIPKYTHKNFLKLLTTPIDLFHGKSFKDVIGELDFDA